MKKLVFFTGAGMSEESGISTFRDAGGLWEGNDIRDVASIDGWKRNPNLVLDFYNKRRKTLLEVQPNSAHFDIADLQEYFEVIVITQNVDDLHERAGNKNVIHLHGELLKARAEHNFSLIYDWRKDINLGTTNDIGDQLRPHIVWFGERVLNIDEAIRQATQAEIFVVIGTSLQVFPAAGIVDYVRAETPFYYIDLSPTITYSFERLKNIKLIQSYATMGLKKLKEELIQEF